MIIPPTILLKSISIDMRWQPKQGARAIRLTAQAPVRDSILIEYSGTLADSNNDHLRTTLETLIEGLYNPSGFYVEFFPGRQGRCFLIKESLNYKWQAVSDLFVEISFSLKMIDSLFIDSNPDNTATYRMP